MTRILAPFALATILFACGQPEPTDDGMNLRDDTLRSADTIEMIDGSGTSARRDTTPEPLDYGHGHEEGTHDSTAAQRHEFHEH